MHERRLTKGVSLWGTHDLSRLISQRLHPITFVWHFAWYSSFAGDIRILIRVLNVFLDFNLNLFFLEGKKSEKDEWRTNWMFEDVIKRHVPPSEEDRYHLIFSDKDGGHPLHYTSFQWILVRSPLLCILLFRELMFDLNFQFKKTTHTSVKNESSAFHVVLLLTSFPPHDEALPSLSFHQEDRSTSSSSSTDYTKSDVNSKVRE